MNTLMNQVKEQGALFNVRQEELLTKCGIKVENRLAIVNESTNGVVGIVSPTYNMVTNGEVLQHMSDALDESSLDLEDMQVKVSSAYDGARTMVDIILPKHEIDIDGDKSQMRITALNSYDGRWKYSTKCGAIRMACLNGQILGNFVGSYVEYHNSKLCVETGAKQLVRMADEFESAEQWWKEMINRKVDREQVIRTFAAFLTGQAKVDDRDKFLSRPQVKHLFQMWEDYQIQMGTNAYALYNVLTDFVTHKERSEKSAPAMLLNDQDKLRKMMEKSRVFAAVK